MRALLLVCLVAALGAAAIAAIPGSAAATSGHCVNLPVTASVKPAIKAAYLHLHGPKHRSNGPTPGTTFYGRCGSTLWASADFPDLGRAETDDQPETFRKLSGHIWHDRGDDGALCTVPLALRKMWGIGDPGPC
jgi:hypothetical protein